MTIETGVRKWSALKFASAQKAEIIFSVRNKILLIFFCTFLAETRNAFYSLLLTIFLDMFADLVTLSCFYCRVNKLKLPFVKQVYVVFAHRKNPEHKKKKKIEQSRLFSSFGLPSKLPRCSCVVLSPTWRLRTSENNTDSAGLTQWSLMGTVEEKPSNNI